MSDPPRHVVLVGMPGSGKSAVAGLLGKILGVPALDLDAAVEVAEGASVAGLFAARGEGGFREAEAAALGAAVAGPPAVVAAGGGVLTTETGRHALGGEGTVTVWLAARLETLRARLGADPTVRPLLATDGALERLERERRPSYRRGADLVVATDDRTPEDVAAETAFRLGTEP